MKRRVITFTVNVLFILTIMTMIIFVFSLSSRKSQNNQIEASTEYTANLKVASNSGLSIYVTGNKVIDLALNEVDAITKVNYKLYYVEPGSIVNISAVNETKIFTTWQMVYENDQATLLNLLAYSNNASQSFTMPDNQPILLSASFRNAYESDRGTYFLAPYFINDAQGMDALAKIVNNDSPMTSDYQIFDPNMTGSAADRNKIIYGYFTITTSFMLNATFKGIGTEENPFYGLIDGKNNNEIAKISLNSSHTINTTGNSGNLYYGLFGCIGKAANHVSLIRNITVLGIITLYENTTNPTGYDNAYIGGFAAIAGSGVLMYNCTSNIDISASTINTNIYVGGFFGKSYTSFEQLSNNTLIAKRKTWNITTNSLSTGNGNIYFGGLAGYAANCYIGSFTSDLTNMTMIGSAKQHGDTYVAGIIGLYDELSSSNITTLTNGKGYTINSYDEIAIANLAISDDDSFNISSQVDQGDAYASTFIAKLKASTTKVNIYNYTYISTSEKNSTINASNKDGNSRGNIYVGGIFAFIEGTNTYLASSLSNDHYIFKGNMEIIATQNGISDANGTIGKVIGGGFVGCGYINLNDTDTVKTTFFNSKNSQIKLQVIQTQFSSHVNGVNTNSGSNYGHISCGMIFGLITDTAMNGKTINNYRFIVNNMKLSGTRAEDALSFGEITIGGLVGYTKNVNIDNVKILANDCEINLNSLSYRVKYRAVGNNAYLGGIVGLFDATSVNTYKMSNCAFAGYRFDNENPLTYNEDNIIGTSSHIKGVQNTQAGGNGDYQGEIYVGGMIGQMKNTRVNDLNFIGSEVNSNSITLTCNNDPDSAMIGGIVGFARCSNGNMSISNCNIIDTLIKAEATVNVTSISNPDIYAAGILGAVYFDNNSNPAYFYNNTASNCRIESYGSIYMKAYAAGICSGSTWTASGYFYNNLSYNNQIIAKSDTADCHASGILCLTEGNRSYVENCATINDVIMATAYSNKIAAAGGIIGNGKTNTTVNNCYVSSYIISENSNNVSKSGRVAFTTGNGITTSNNSNILNDDKLSNVTAVVYNNSSSNSNRDTKLFFTDLLNLSTNYTNNNIFDATVYSGTVKIPNTSTSTSIDGERGTTITPKTYLEINNDIFNSTYNNNLYGVTNNGNNGVSNATLWVRIINIGSADYYPNSSNIEEAHANGWYEFGSRKLATSGSIIHSIDIDYDNTNAQIEQGMVEDINAPYYFIKTTPNHTNDKIIAKLRTSTLPISFILKVLEGTTITNDIALSVKYQVYDGTQYINIDNELLGKLGNFALKQNEDYTYSFNYSPNNECLDFEGKLLKLIFYTDNDQQVSIEFDIKTNVYDDMNITYSSSTTPLNAKVNQDDDTFGSITNPFIITNQSTFKIIPSFMRRNEPNRITLDENTSVVLYQAEAGTINNNTWTYQSDVDIKSSGEMVIGNVASGTIYKVSITLYDSINVMSLPSEDVYIKILAKSTVSANLVGTTYTGASNIGIYDGTNGVDYHFTITPKYGYGDIPLILTIQIGSTTYDLINNKNNTGITGLIINTLPDENNITSNSDNVNQINWIKSDNGYEIIIPQNYITDDIIIDVTFPVIYSLVFDVNLGFANIPDEQRFLTIESISTNTISSLIGLTLQHNDSGYFYDLNEKNQAGDYTCILKQMESLAPYGYALHGWYLIDDASYALSYGNSIEDLLARFANENGGLEKLLDGSYTFYARWSFAILINEAPGTTVKCSFPSHFLVKDENFVDVPINNKKGFSFTIIKSDGFSGEADVIAHVLEEVVVGGQTLRVLTEVIVEKYHENMYIYKIAPEDIRGVLVITTYSNDASFIVGELTNSVEENIIPEDGVFTIKYVVNHQQDITKHRQSFAYDNENKDLLKKLLIKFNNGENAYNLPVGTEVKLYYLVNGMEVSVGYLKLTEATSQLYSTDFKIINSNNNQFNQNETFAMFLNNANSKAETYYFVITPPNGYTNLVNDSTFLNCSLDIGYIHPTTNDWLHSNRYLDGSTIIDSKYYPDIYNINEQLMKDIAHSEDTFLIYKTRNTSITSDGLLGIIFTDEQTTISVNDTIYVGHGDFRHQDKYFVLGIQLYLANNPNKYINLAGLKIITKCNDIVVNEQSIQDLTPRNAIYVQLASPTVSNTGVYTFEIQIEDASLAIKSSGITSTTPFGIKATLLESSSIAKPAFGTIRYQYVNEVGYDLASGYIDINPEIQAINALFDDVVLQSSVQYNENAFSVPNTVMGDGVNHNISWSINNNIVTSPIDLSIYAEEDDVTIYLVGKVNTTYNGQPLTITRTYPIKVTANPLYKAQANARLILDEIVNRWEMLYSNGTALQDINNVITNLDISTIPNISPYLDYINVSLIDNGDNVCATNGDINHLKIRFDENSLQSFIIHLDYNDGTYSFAIDTTVEHNVLIKGLSKAEYLDYLYALIKAEIESKQRANYTSSNIIDELNLIGTKDNYTINDLSAYFDGLTLKYKVEINNPDEIISSDGTVDKYVITDNYIANNTSVKGANASVNKNISFIFTPIIEGVEENSDYTTQQQVTIKGYNYINWNYNNVTSLSGSSVNLTTFTLRFSSIKRSNSNSWQKFNFKNSNTIYNDNTMNNIKRVSIWIDTDYGTNLTLTLGTSTNNLRTTGTLTKDNSNSYTAGRGTYTLFSYTNNSANVYSYFKLTNTTNSQAYFNKLIIYYE